MEIVSFDSFRFVIVGANDRVVEAVSLEHQDLDAYPDLPPCAALIRFLEPRLPPPPFALAAVLVQAAEESE